MEFLEQENTVLREELAALQTKMDEMNELVKTLTAAQNQPPPPPPPVSTQAGTSTFIVPEWVTCADIPTHSAPQHSAPWFPPFTAGEVLRPIASEIPMPTLQQEVHVRPTLATTPPVAMTYSAPVVHTVPQNEEPLFHSGAVGANNGVDDLREMYEKMNREMQALRGKEIFGKNVYDMCLVPNVQIPYKFKLPDFEKYKGTSCPKDHLTMYVRKMSTYANDHQVLIHYFQDSLAGAALKWYMNLDRTKVRTFNDLCDAFVQQYKFNVDMAPDRSDLQAMTQKDRETFKEYAQRWRDIAAQVSPRIEEKEMTKLFLKTLSQFYYERMVGSTPRDFSEMVSIGTRLEEGVREGRLVKESVPAGGSKKKDQEVNTVKDQSRQQVHPQFNPHHQAQKAPQYDPIPMKYAELLPSLLESNLVQTRPPPPIPKKLPARWRPDLSCVFHQGAQGHDVEHCFSLKIEVQKLIDANVLPFKNLNPNV